MEFNPEDPFADVKPGEQVLDTDLSWDSPHHTLGIGATQASPGNHKHPNNLEQGDIKAGSNISVVPQSDGSVLISGADPGSPLTDHRALDFLNAPDQHTVAAVIGLQDALDGKSNTGHSHTGYADVGHTHTYGPYFRYGRPNVAFPIGSNQSTGEIVIAHGLGRVPYAVFVSADDDGGDCTVFASVNRFDATNIIAKMRNIGGDEAHVYINWIAF